MSKDVIGKYIDTPKEKIALEIFKCIRRGEALNRTQLSLLFGISTKTVGKYISSLRNIWNVNIEYDTSCGKYIIINEGDLKGISAANPLTVDDVNLILYTIIQSKTFIPSKISLIQNSLLSFLPIQEAEELKRLLPPTIPDYVTDGSINSYIRIIREAISDQKKVSFSYMHQNIDGFENCKVIPYSFAWDLGKYYLIAKPDSSETLYHYRIDRMRNVIELSESGLRSEDFIVEKYLKRTWYMWSGKETHIKVKFKNEAYQVVTERSMSDGQVIVEPNEEGYFVYEFIANGTDGILWWLMGFGDAAEILEPVGLRVRVKEIIYNMNKLYK